MFPGFAPGAISRGILAARGDTLTLEAWLAQRTAMGFPLVRTSKAAE